MPSPLHSCSSCPHRQPDPHIPSPALRNFINRVHILPGGEQFRAAGTNRGSSACDMPTPEEHPTAPTASTHTESSTEPARAVSAQQLCSAASPPPSIQTTHQRKRKGGKKGEKKPNKPKHKYTHEKRGRKNTPKERRRKGKPTGTERRERKEGGKARERKGNKEIGKKMSLLAPGDMVPLG